MKLYAKNEQKISVFGKSTLDHCLSGFLKIRIACKGTGECAHRVCMGRTSINWDIAYRNDNETTTKQQIYA